ncbi:MAG: hypothetical protein HYX24_06545 [Candidatus Aenigmarchaeota archaeon]|nr:hypothetical protein [Candidatus Aenigmarchaeota archaeon]
MPSSVRKKIEETIRDGVKSIPKVTFQQLREVQTKRNHPSFGRVQGDS